MKLILDLETSFQTENNKTDPSPFNPKNFLVSAGWWCEETGYQYRFYNHKHLTVDGGVLWELHAELQSLLDKTTYLIAHNAKFELQWLNAVGLTYNGKIHCTMIREYVLAKGQKLSVSLKESCIRNDVARKKSDIIDKYLKDGIGFDQMPLEVVEEYGLADVQACKELFENQQERLNKDKHLIPTINLMEEFCRCLTDIETNGIKIDVAALDALEKEFRAELNTLISGLTKTAKEVMGATPINLDSPEQLSWVLYSRKVTDKNKWKELFNLGSEIRGSVTKTKYKRKMNSQDFVSYVKTYTEPVQFTSAEQCVTCSGTGRVQRIKVNGDNFSKQSICKDCQGSGIRYILSGKIAGFKLIPKDSTDVAVGGFSTSHDSLERLKHSASARAKIFIDDIQRANSIRTYIDTFINGIRIGLRNNNILHTQFMQCVTATGRLSSRTPNFQNMPRANTFPIRKVVISRFPGGEVLSGDAKQLEFRIAGELSGDKQIFEDVIGGIDVHASTARETGLSRQDSKPHTFAPVYGATDKGKADNIAKYYRYFQDRYRGLFEAHIKWAERVLSTGEYILPSGRTYVYPNTKRFSSGGISNKTIIANYPVQGFATGDLMIIYCINVWKLFRQHGLRSLVILEVHDDVTVDVHPYEKDIALKLMNEAFMAIPYECEKRYDYKMSMPLDVEFKVGPNWLNQKEIHCE